VLPPAETGRLVGLVAAQSVTTLFYLLAKSGSPDTARVNIIELLSVLEVAPIDGHVLEQALALPYRDLEDAVQMAAARQAGADYLVTRNRAGYAAGPLRFVVRRRPEGRQRLRMHNRSESRGAACLPLCLTWTKPSRSSASMASRPDTRRRSGAYGNFKSGQERPSDVNQSEFLQIHFCCLLEIGDGLLD
jgi:hypothetical protein